MQSTVPRTQFTRIIKPTTTNTRKMSLLFPRFAYAPAMRCGPARHHEVAPLWNLFDDTLHELQRASRQSSPRQWNPRFDVKETKEAYSLEGELPGIDQKDINIEFVDEHTITIKGRHEQTTERGQRPSSTAALEETPATPTSETSEKSSLHHATVEDDVEEPANSSAVANTEAAPEQEVSQTQAQPEPQKTTDSQYWYRERSVGSFSRSFSFASRVNQDAVKASLKNGVLSIVVPKAAAPESRRINIE